MNGRCILVRPRAVGAGGRYNQFMITPIRILGLALVIGLIAALCLLSAATATVVGGVTVAAVAIDALRHQPPQAPTTERTITVDLSSRD